MPPMNADAKPSWMCTHCGYDLAGIHTVSVTFPCPECGEACDRRLEPGIRPVQGPCAVMRSFAHVCWPVWIAVPVLYAVGQKLPNLASVMFLTGAFAVMVSPWITAGRFVRQRYQTTERFIPHLVLGFFGMVVGVVGGLILGAAIVWLMK